MLFKLCSTCLLKLVSFPFTSGVTASEPARTVLIGDTLELSRCQGLTWVDQGPQACSDRRRIEGERVTAQLLLSSVKCGFLEEFNRHEDLVLQSVAVCESVLALISILGKQKASREKQSPMRRHLRLSSRIKHTKNYAQ